MNFSHCSQERKAVTCSGWTRICAPRPSTHSRCYSCSFCSLAMILTYPKYLLRKTSNRNDSFKQFKAQLILTEPHEESADVFSLKAFLTEFEGPVTMKNVLFHIIKRPYRESFTVKGTRHPTHIFICRHTYVHIYTHTYLYIKNIYVAISISYLLYIVFLLRPWRRSHYIYIYASIHSTEKMGEGEMVKKHEHINTAGEEWSSEVVLIQAPRGRLRQYICPNITAKGQMGEKYWACRERGVETAGSQHEETVMHLLKLLIAGIWEFAVFYTFCFLSASLCSCPLLPKYYCYKDQGLTS